MSNFMLFQEKTPNRIAVVSGLRTPFVRQATVFKDLSALELGKLLVSELISNISFSPQMIEQLIFGQVIQMPQAPNIAREIVLGTGMNVNTDAYSVSRACATSFQSVFNVAQSISLGSIQIGIAGGADSSSVLPIGVSRKLATSLLSINKAKSLTQKLKILKQLSVTDLLPVPPAVAEYSTGLTMGQTAEQMAKTFGISRKDQDAFAHRSHLLAHDAWSQGLLKGEVMTAFPEPYQEWIDKDNLVRENSQLEDYEKLRPAFDKKYGSVTAGNSSPLTDGAAAVLMMSEQKAKDLGIKPLGYIRSAAFTAINVKENMLLGPAYSTPIALEKAGLSLSDLSFVDMHEAFASQVLANLKSLASDKFSRDHLNRSKAVGEIDMDKLNPLGGSIAYGHPFAATGARMIVQSLRELKRRGGGFALNTACAAGGLGAAMVLEADND